MVYVHIDADIWLVVKNEEMAKPAGETVLDHIDHLQNIISFDPELGIEDVWVNEDPVYEILLPDQPDGIAMRSEDV